jgi:uncharacterized protein YkuJ
MHRKTNEGRYEKHQRNFERPDRTVAEVKPEK